MLYIKSLIRYIPTCLWGKNGHFQTMLHALMGRFGEKVPPKGRLHTLYAVDGATITYSFYSSQANMEDSTVSL